MVFMMFFSGCSGKQQVNKLPDEEKIYLPKDNKNKKFWLSDKPKESFNKYVIEEFNHGYKKTEEAENKPKDFWLKGYEIDKKRY